MGPIIISAELTATNADILSGTRLETAPANGVMTFEMQSADSIATNNYVATLQLPDGDVPMNGVLVPGTDTAGLTGILRDTNKLMLSVPVSQGGHVVFGLTETGDTECIYRVTFTPLKR